MQVMFQGLTQDFRKEGVVSQHEPQWGVTERATQEKFENTDCEIRHFGFLKPPPPGSACVPMLTN